MQAMRERRPGGTVRPQIMLPGLPGRSARRRRAWSAACLLSVPILAITLHGGAATSNGGFCLWCGHFALADAFLNVALFVPLGIALGLALPRAARLAVLLALGLSVSIELAQLLLPGRFATVADVAANGLGAAIGVRAVSYTHLTLPTILLV